MKKWRTLRIGDRVEFAGEPHEVVRVVRGCAAYIRRERVEVVEVKGRSFEAHSSTMVAISLSTPRLG